MKNLLILVLLAGSACGDDSSTPTNCTEYESCDEEVCRYVDTYTCTTERCCGDSCEITRVTEHRC